MDLQSVDLVLVAGSVLAGSVGAVPAVRSLRRSLELRGRTRALLSRLPQRLGELFPLTDCELEAAREAERRGALGVVRVRGRWFVYRKASC